MIELFWKQLRERTWKFYVGMFVLGQIIYWGMKAATPYLVPSDYHFLLKAFFAFAFVVLMIAVFGNRRKP